MFAFLVIFLVLWFACGFFAARIAVIDFERKFGEGTGRSSGLMVFFFGFAGLFTSLVCGTGSIKAALGLEPVRLDAVDPAGVYYIDKRRDKFSEFVTKGVKGLPSYDANTIAYQRKYPLLDIVGRRY